MDPRIQKMVVWAEATSKCSRLEEERLELAFKTFTDFLSENMDGILLIFKYNKATFVIINEYFAEHDCLCFNPNDGFHFRKHKDTDSSPDTQRTLVRKVEDIHELFSLIKKANMRGDDMEDFQNDFVRAVCNSEKYCTI